MSAENLTLAQLMRARDVLDAASVPVPEMYFDRRTGEWFRRERDAWVLIPAIDNPPQGE